MTIFGCFNTFQTSNKTYRMTCSTGGTESPRKTTCTHISTYLTHLNHK